MVDMDNENFNPFEYVKEMKESFSEPQKFFLRNLHKFFEASDVKNGICIEIGCGPTIHSVASASKFCDRIVSTDYLSVNTDIVSKWKNGDKNIPDIEHFLEFIAELEGHENPRKGKAEIADRIRPRIRIVSHCNVLAPQPISKDIVQEYDVMITCLCLEAACSKGWNVFKESVRKLSTLLRKDGHFLIMGVLEQTYWEADDVRYPCLPLAEDGLKKNLKDAGFDKFIFTSMKRPDNCMDKSDFTGLFFLSCKKQ